jgi:hypothetical protein
MRRRRTLKLFLIASAVAVISVLAGLALAVASSGSLTTYGGTRMPTAPVEISRAPDWTRPCWRRTLTDARPLLAACAKVTGRVVTALTGDSDGDAKVVIVEHYRLVVLSYQRGSWPRPLPTLGDTVTAVGPMVRGNDGEAEIHAWGT